MKFKDDTLTTWAKRKYLEVKTHILVHQANREVERVFKFQEETLLDTIGVKAALGATFLVVMTMAIYIAATQILPISTEDRAYSTKTTMTLPVEEPTAPETIPAPEITAMIEPEAAPIIDDVVVEEKPEVVKPKEEKIASLPSLPLSLPVPDSTAPYILAVDKVRKVMFVFVELSNRYEVAARFPVALGPKSGDKMLEHDLKTPEGLYKIVKILKKPELANRYGPRAFVLNYPNEVDQKLGKTGNGIWIHGSGLGERTEDTEGCVEVSDKNIEFLERFIRENTPVYIFPEEYKIPQIRGVLKKSVLSAKTVYSLKDDGVTYQ